MSKTTRTTEPLNPKLPGRYGKMTAQEFEQDVAKFDEEFSGDSFHPTTPTQRREWEQARNKGGRPKIGRGAKRVLVTVERGLLEEADAYAKDHGKSRSQLMAEGLRLVMARKEKSRKQSA